MSASNLPAGAPMTDFEKQVVEILAQLFCADAGGSAGLDGTPCIRHVEQGERLAPRVAAAIIAARQVFQSVTFDNTNAWMDNENAPQQDADAMSNKAALGALRGEIP